MTSRRWHLSLLTCAGAFARDPERFAQVGTASAGRGAEKEESGRRDSNPRDDLGRVGCYRYITPARD